MRDTFVKTLINLAKENEKIEIVTGDLGFGVLKPYWEEIPDQFTNAGIAEQNMTSLAAGMAMCGKIVFTYSIGNFPTLRCLEQIRNDCAYMDANVKIVCVGGGFVYGPLGMSHQATEDIACLRALPNVKVFAPGDPVEAEAVTKAIVDIQGTCYLRLGRGGEKKVHQTLIDFAVGKAIKIRDCLDRAGRKVAVFSTGAILDETYVACENLEQLGTAIAQYSFPTIKPIDESLIEKICGICDYIVTVEEHNVVGGFGSAVSEVVAATDTNVKLIKIGLQDIYCEKVGSQKYLRKQYKMDANAIFNKIIELL